MKKKGSSVFIPVEPSLFFLKTYASLMNRPIERVDQVENGPIYLTYFDQFSNDTNLVTHIRPDSLYLNTFTFNLIWENS